MEYKNSIWAEKIIKIQHKDGSWGYFHSLSNPTKEQPMTTEQALRRLKILGYSINDKPIQKAVNYLNNCLIKKMEIPDRQEKVHNWKIFTELMLSTWIKIFTVENKKANEIANNWSNIINGSFENGIYDNLKYITLYEKILGLRPKGGRLIDFINFYPVSLMTNILDKKIEPLFFKYVLNHNYGIYYLWDKILIKTPEVFNSKYTNRYLNAIELLAEYNCIECKKQLDFIKKWLNQNMIDKNKWDLGKEAKDGINFPLSDSWRKEKDRINDCSYRIIKLLEKLK